MIDSQTHKEIAQKMTFLFDRAFEVYTDHKDRQYVATYAQKIRPEGSWVIDEMKTLNITPVLDFERAEEDGVGIMEAIGEQKAVWLINSFKTKKPKYTTIVDESYQDGFIGGAKIRASIIDVNALEYLCDIKKQELKKGAYVHIDYGSTDKQYKSEDIKKIPEYKKLWKEIHAKKTFTGGHVDFHGNEITSKYNFYRDIIDRAQYLCDYMGDKIKAIEEKQGLSAINIKNFEKIQDEQEELVYTLGRYHESGAENIKNINYALAEYIGVMKEAGKTIFPKDVINNFNNGLKEIKSRSGLYLGEAMNVIYRN